MTLERSKRSWSEKQGGRRDVDGAARARLLKSMAWGLAPGLFFGTLVGARIGGLLGLVAGIALAATLAFSGYFIAEGSGAVAGALLSPSAGLGKPPTNSRADALEARGDFRAAVDAWEVTAAEHPDHPDPPARVARLYRDRLGDPETAMVWFRRAVDRGGLGSEVRVIVRELVETARKADATGRAAAPMLSRYRDAQDEGSPEEEWASRELAAIKEAIRGADLS